MTRYLIAATAALFLFAETAPAQQGLAGESDLNAGLQVFAAANLIRRRCETIEPRRALALSYLRTLAEAARARGYSNSAIRAYVEDRAAKDRVEGRARAYLASRGLSQGSPEEFCRVGRAEIAEATPIGALLRAR